MNYAVPPPPPTPPQAPDGPSAERPQSTTGVLVIAGPIEHGHVQHLCDRLQAVIASSDAEVIVCDVSALPAGANAVEALARLQLTARRSNCHIRLQRASRCLAHLLEFVGIADVIAVGSR